MRLSHIKAASKSRIIGRDTKNKDNGSGGENAAPKTKVVNQICRRYASNVARSTAPDWRDNVVINGAWNPITHAKQRLIMKPINDDNRHSVDKPADCASVAK